MTDTRRTAEPTPSEVADPVDVPASAPRRWWMVPPVDRRGLIVWIAAYVAMTAVATAVGLLVVHELGGVRSLDVDVARWLARRRSDAWDSLTWGGSIVADAYVKIPATLVLCALFLWRWRRWTEVALLAGALILEVAVFTTTAMIVDRPRPPIPHLDPVPPTGAFPSGHSAAAVAFYGAIAIIVWWHTHRRLMRAIATTVAVLMPLVVAASRMYRGMHSLTDVVIGMVIGAISLWATWLVTRDGPAAREGGAAAAREWNAPVMGTTPS
ncbi:MAG: phosphatase PAP2 family protein [Acidimicrobiia bacterium]